ncbi:unnamed protein product [Spirodela intermedia]|uniref:Uncharacterized protein n=1 Tax=Spirodela intermedia TaxID=51605 RepID=A0A7I8IM50_SPIIN|nr:unnamed protein product [Spirodela intermedia]CAA6659045.1 unnamed protein product [Spirodela intermedia]
MARRRPQRRLPRLADGGFFLPPGESTRVNTPVPWSGRLWARTGCEFDSPRPGLTCRTGDCQGRFACNGTTGAPPATLIEMNLQRHGRSFYDVSLVDGYNLAVSVSAAPPGDGGASSAELQVMDGGGEVVACKSACMAFDLDDYCCRNAFGNEETCRPSSYSMLFKEICPSYRTYAFDKRRPPSVAPPTPSSSPSALRRGAAPPPCNPPPLR